MFLFSVCKVNVHKRCQKNVANTCGINTRDLSVRLKDLGIITDIRSTRKKVSLVVWSIFLVYFSVCKINVHKRCQKNVANNCGINTREMAEILSELGITTDKHGTKKKVSVCVVPFFGFIDFLFFLSSSQSFCLVFTQFRYSLFYLLNKTM